MNVQVNHNSSVRLSQESIGIISTEMKDRFGRFGDTITRIDVFFSDENGSKKGFEDKRCVMEAHVAHMAPEIVKADSINLFGAFEDASDKLLESMNAIMGRIRDVRDSESISDYPSL